MGLVFAAIAPHGGLAIAEACTATERLLATSTRAGMEELGRLFTAARPEAVVVATPHNVHISNAMGVVVAGRVAGHLAGAPPSIALDVPAGGEVRLARRFRRERGPRARPPRRWSVRLSRKRGGVRRIDLRVGGRCSCCTVRPQAGRAGSSHTGRRPTSAC